MAFTLRFVLLLLPACASLAANADPQHPLANLVGRTVSATVTHVSDGDTFDVIPSGEIRAIRVRLFGVDAPEKGEPFANQARNRTRVLIFQKNVRLTGVSIDTYGRLVARVGTDTGDLALSLLREGLACHYQRYSNDGEYAAAETAARSAGAGFWPHASRPRCASTQPRDVQRSVVTVHAVVGNVSSRVFHSQTCRNATCKNCTRVFRNPEEALAAGFRPAGDCFRQAP